jgi:hypothetical protein
MWGGIGAAAVDWGGGIWLGDGEEEWGWESGGDEEEEQMACLVLGVSRLFLVSGNGSARL